MWGSAVIGDLTSDTATELRRAFDRSFAKAPRERVAQFEDLLAIRIAGDPFALRLNELSGLSTGQPVTPVPTAAAGLLGIAGFRGTLVPVYDLRILLGYPATEASLWLGLVGKDLLTGLAFDGFDGFLRVPRDAVARKETVSATALVHEVVQTRDSVWPLVHLPSVVEEITKRVRHSTLERER